MKPSLQNVYDIIDRQLDNFHFEVKDFDNYITLNSTVSFNQYKGNVYIEITCYEEGTTYLICTFDQIDPDDKVFQLLNEFNNKSAWFKAYINHTEENLNYLSLQSCNIGSQTTEDLANVTIFYVGQLVSDDTIKLLKPLTEMTH